nr:MAG TPA: hypothetical protein [Caudoviricetes sp.]
MGMITLLFFAVNGILQGLTGLELDSLLSRNLHLFSGLRISSHTSLSLLNTQLAKLGDVNTVAILKGKLSILNEGIDNGGSFLDCHVQLVRHGLNDFIFLHRFISFLYLYFFLA